MTCLGYIMKVSAGFGDSELACDPPFSHYGSSIQMLVPGFSYRSGAISDPEEQGMMCWTECLALLREWKGEFRRHADGTDGMHTRECSTIDFSRCLFLVTPEACWETRACGKHRDGCGDPRRIRIWCLFFTYTPVSTVSLIF